MKKTLMLCGILLATSLASPPSLFAQSSPSSSLKNADFKQVGSDGYPDLWQAYPPPTGDNQKMAMDPAGGIKMTDNDKGNGLGLAQWVTVTPGTKYSGKLTVTGEGAINLVLIFVNKIPGKAAMINKVAIKQYTGSFSAAKQDPVIATVPDGAAFMRVFIYSPKPGVCDLTIKNIELKTADGSAPESASTKPAPASGAQPAPAAAHAPVQMLDASGKPVASVHQNGPEVLPAGTIHTIDFETGDYSQGCLLEGGNKAIVSAPEPVRSGKYAMKVMLTHDQKRTEITGPRSTPYGEFKYGWSIYLPATFDGQSFFSIVTQWHTWGTGPTIPSDGGPPTSISIAGDQWSIKVQHQAGADPKPSKQYIPFGSIAEDKGKWTDFYMEVNWQSATTGGGYLRLYKNGVKVVDYNGPTWFDQREKGPFFKMGVYKGSLGWRGNESGAILYFDNFRMGDKAATREQIDPTKQPH